MSPKWIFLRGLTRGNGHWGSFPKKFQERNPNLIIELLEIPGNGTKNKESTPIDPLEVISILRKNSKTAGGHEKFHLCGISLGGMIALKWAEQFPQQVESVTMINSSLRQNSTFYRRLKPGNYFKVAKLLLESNPMKRERGILELTVNNSTRIKENITAFAKFSKNHPCTRENFFRQLVLASNITISEIPHVPMKIIYSENDGLVNPRCSVDMGELLRIDPISHPTAGHDLPLDDPKWLCDVLLGKIRN